LHLTKTEVGELTLSLALPPNHHFTADASSRWQVIADEDSPLLIEEAKASGSLGKNKTIRIPVRLNSNTNDGLLRVEALAYFCEDEGPCKVSGVLFEVPVALGQTPGGTVELNHTLGKNPIRSIRQPMADNND
jgi:hypothetical protein